MHIPSQGKTRPGDQQGSHALHADAPTQSASTTRDPDGEAASRVGNRNDVDDPLGSDDAYLPGSGGSRTGANPSGGGIDSSRGWGQGSDSNNTMGSADVQTDMPGTAGNVQSIIKRTVEEGEGELHSNRN